MPIKKYLKAIQYQKIQIKVILNYNKACDNICQGNMGTNRIYETKIINNWKEDNKKNIQIYEGYRKYMEE
jgi:hypothetical protein